MANGLGKLFVSSLLVISQVLANQHQSGPDSYLNNKIQTPRQIQTLRWRPFYLKDKVKSINDLKDTGSGTLRVRSPHFSTTFYSSLLAYSSRISPSMERRSRAWSMGSKAEYKVRSNFFWLWKTTSRILNSLQATKDIKGINIPSQTPHFLRRVPTAE